MSFFLKLILSLLLIPVFLVLLLLVVPILLLIACLAPRGSRRVHIKTFTAIWPPEQNPKQEKASVDPKESVYDVECTVISSTPLETGRDISGDDSAGAERKPPVLPAETPSAPEDEHKK